MTIRTIPKIILALREHLRLIFPAYSIEFDYNNENEPIIIIQEVVDDPNPCRMASMRILIEDALLYIRVFAKPDHGVIYTLDLAHPNSITRLERIIRQNASTLRYRVSS